MDTLSTSQHNADTTNEEPQLPLRQVVKAQVNGVNRLNIAQQGYVADIIFIMSEGAVIPIPPLLEKEQHKKLLPSGHDRAAKAYDQAMKEAEELGEKAQALVIAKTNLNTTGSAQNVIKAQDDVRKALAAHTNIGDESSQAQSTNNAGTEPTPPPLNTERQDFIEVFSFAKQMFVLLPVKTISEARTLVETDDNVYYINTKTTTEYNTNEQTKTTHTRSKKQPITLKDALKGLRFNPLKKSESSNPPSGENTGSSREESETGALDSEKVKQAFTPVKKQIAMDWKLGEVRTKGQIPSRILAKALAPNIANFFSEEDFEALDGFVTKINDSATKRWGKYDERRKELIDELTKCVKKTQESSVFSSVTYEVDLAPEDWDKIQRKVKDIWWDGWEMLDGGVLQNKAENEYQQFAQNFNGIPRPDSKSLVDKVTKLLTETNVPPVVWDGSAGAQILRYSAGATFKADFDVLETGKLGVAGSADASFNLLEAKADVSCWLPSTEGVALEFELPIRKKEGHWAKITDPSTGKHKNFLPAKPNFAFDKSLLCPEGIIALGEGLQTWGQASKAIVVSELAKQAAKQDTPLDENITLKIQIAGHTDAVGAAGYNQALSERRAQAGLGFLANRPAIWFKLFNDGHWAAEEARFMAAAILCHSSSNYKFNWRMIDGEAALLAQIREQLNKSDNTSNNSVVLDGDWAQPIAIDAGLSESDLQALEKHLSQQSTKGVVSLFQAFKPVTLTGPVVFESGEWSVNSPTGAATLQKIITEYFEMSRYVISQAIPADATFFDKISFHTDEFIGLGESQLDINTNARNKQNRRLELIPYGITSQTELMEKAPYNFGKVRLELSGKVSGEAGVNLNLGAKIDFEVNKDLLVVGGLAAAALEQDVTIAGSASTKFDPAISKEYEKETLKGAPEKGSATRTLADFNAAAEVKGGAFVGAKAEAGVKAAIDWSPPEKSFLRLGDVGYTVTGMAGAGLEGEFKIGFDRESSRFQIKVKAQASLGLGCGGAFSFSVSVKHMFEFAQLVHEKLSDNDFHFIDVFDNNTDASGIDVYKLFTVWSYEMLQQGHVLQAGLAYVAGGALESTSKLLSRATEVIEDWEEQKMDADNLTVLIDTINRNPPQLALCTPETKGRLLYRLLQAKVQRQGDGFWEQRFKQFQRWGTEPARRAQELLNLDRYHSIEKAALKVITVGVASPRDWQKTLQNVAAIDSNGYMVPVGSNQDGDSLDAKATRTLENETDITTVLLSDKDDYRALENHLVKIGVRR